MLGCKYNKQTAETADDTGINRYMLGCKYINVHESGLFRFGINRYMLGCKYIPDVLGIDIANGINRYMLGCKFVNLIDKEYLRAELIDTCWDVNLALRYSRSCARKN